jgi:SAM-dependent methyltransferase
MDGPRLYQDLASWWPVLSHPMHYEEEAGLYKAALEAEATRPIREVLEIGCGGGNNASYLKAAWRMTLVDLAPGMLEVSRALNPECEHLEGDMRTLRLERTFDAVFVHDAIAYMTTEADLRAAIETAYAHCRPGGAALFCPDATKESFKAHTSHGGHDAEGRSMRYLEWTYDPDPTDTTYLCQMAYLLREGDGEPRVVRDEHVMGLFPDATWLRLIGDVGFEPARRPFRHSELPPDSTCDLFLGRKPA